MLETLSMDRQVQRHCLCLSSVHWISLYHSRTEGWVPSNTVQCLKSANGPMLNCILHAIIPRPFDNSPYARHPDPSSWWYYNRAYRIKQYCSCGLVSSGTMRMLWFQMYDSASCYGRKISECDCSGLMSRICPL